MGYYGQSKDDRVRIVWVNMDIVKEIECAENELIWSKYRCSSALNMG